MKQCFCYKLKSIFTLKHALRCELYSKLPSDNPDDHEWRKAQANRATDSNAKVLLFQWSGYWPISRRSLRCSLCSCSVPTASHSTHVQDSWQGKPGQREAWAEVQPMTHTSLAPHAKQQSCHKNQHWLKPFVYKWNKSCQFEQPTVQSTPRELPKAPKSQEWQELWGTCWTSFWGVHSSKAEFI